MAVYCVTQCPGLSAHDLVPCRITINLEANIKVAFKSGDVCSHVWTMQLRLGYGPCQTNSGAVATLVPHHTHRRLVMAEHWRI